MGIKFAVNLQRPEVQPDSDRSTENTTKYCNLRDHLFHVKCMYLIVIALLEITFQFDIKFIFFSFSSDFVGHD